jgi:hypothetical protein
VSDPNDVSSEVHEHEPDGSHYDPSPNLSVEDDAFLHAEREWNVFRTIPLGAANWYGSSGVLAASLGETPGTEAGFSIQARSTRAYVVITNHSAADFLTINSGGNYPAKGTPTVALIAACGAGFVLGPGLSLTIPTRAPVYITAAGDAAAGVPFSYLEIFD